MTLIQKLIMLDQRLSMRPAQPVVPRIPTLSEERVRAILKSSAQGHAKVLEAVGISRA